MRIAPPVAALLVCATFVTSTARAEEAEITTPASTAAPDSGYWYQLAAVDAASMVALYSMRFAEGPNGQDTKVSDALFFTGFFGGMFGAPAVHVVHGRGWRTVGSLAMHFLLPALAQGIAMRSAGCDNAAYCDYDRATPWLIGIGVAGAIDVLWDRFHADEVPEAAPAPSRPPRAFSLSPVMGFSGNGGVAGLAGRF